MSMSDFATEVALAILEEGLADRDGDEDYLKLTTPKGLNPCPACGSPGELWQRKVQENYHRVVVCTNNGRKESDYQCPFYFPPENFYKATKREAIEYWQKHTVKHES